MQMKTHADEESNWSPIFTKRKAPGGNLLLCTEMIVICRSSKTTSHFYYDLTSYSPDRVRARKPL